jgi:hypothetical protein
MEDSLAFTFTSTLTLEAMEPRLQQAGGLDWQSRTAAQGFYLRGLTANGAKVRLLRAEPGYLAEVHFPIGPGWTRFADPEKAAFLAWVKELLTATAAGSNYQDR